MHKTIHSHSPPSQHQYALQHLAITSLYITNIPTFTYEINLIYVLITFTIVQDSVHDPVLYLHQKRYGI